MRRFLANLRAALDARYEREIDYLRDRHSWLSDYHIEPPIRSWYAVRKDDHTMIGPAKNITALDTLILADYQSRPIVRRPVLLPLPEHDGDATRLDMPVWPYGNRRDVS